MVYLAGNSVLLDVNYILRKAGIGEEMRVAALGCGASGHFVFPSAELVGKGGLVYAVDILKPVLENIKRRAKLENYENIETVWSNLEIFNATKIESGSLDVDFLINTMYQSHKRGEMMREAARLLKKDGRLLIVEWKNIASPFGPPPSERVDINQVKAVGKKLGLNIQAEFEAGQFHYGVLFSK